MNSPFLSPRDVVDIVHISDNHGHIFAFWRKVRGADYNENQVAACLFCAIGTSDPAAKKLCPWIDQFRQSRTAKESSSPPKSEKASAKST